MQFQQGNENWIQFQSYVWTEFFITISMSTQQNTVFLPLPREISKNWRDYEKRSENKGIHEEKIKKLFS